MDDVWFVYALYSPQFDKIYIGMSQDPERRLSEHNSKMVKSTKAFIPWIKVYQKEVGNIVKARYYEKHLKSTSGRKFIRNIINKLNFSN
jgi:putative endonuclease